MDGGSVFVAPVLDLEGIYAEDGGGLEKIGKEILDVGGKYGIFQLKNHGISLDKFQKYFDLGDKFFDLPHEKKEKYKRTLLPWQGWAIEESKINGVKVEMNQSYDMCRTDIWFPEKETPGFKEAAIDCFSETTRLGERLIMALDIVLDSGNYLQKCHVNSEENWDGSQVSKLLRYPPIPQFADLGSVLLKSHQDVSSVSLLYTSADGLQIKDKDDQWRLVKNAEDTILLIFGQSLQIFSGGRLPAVEHRVICTENQMKPNGWRRSFAHFHNPRASTLLKPLDGSGSPASAIVAGDLVETGSVSFYKYEL